MTSAETGPQRLRVQIRGAVQGVGFRPFVYRLARELDRCASLTKPDSGCEAAWAVNRRRFFRQDEPPPEIERVKDQLLKSNPVLEAFGTAKTLRMTAPIPLTRRVD